MSSKFRPVNAIELGILEAMLSADFHGVEVLRKQLPNLEVREIDGERSLELKVSNQVRTTFRHAVPVKANYCDTEPYEASGQVHVYILLHVSNGLMSELQIYKADGTTIERLPEPAELHVYTPDNSDHDWLSTDCTRKGV